MFVISQNFTCPLVGNADIIQSWFRSARYRTCLLFIDMEPVSKVYIGSSQSQLTLFNKPFYNCKSYYPTFFPASTISSFPNVKKQDVETIIARFFNNARDRRGGRKRRSPVHPTPDDRDNKRPRLMSAGTDDDQ